MKIKIRRASSDEAETLTVLAHAAKRHWGYPESYMRLWTSDLTFEPEFIRSHPVYAACDGDHVVGVYALAGEGADRSIEHLWVDPGAMGRGIGASLYEHAAQRASSDGARRLRILSDPNAEGFYIKMGARRIGEEPSTPAGRMLPLLEADLGRGQVSS